MTVVTPDWLHPASLVRVIDGDTFELKLDLGTYIHTKVEATVRIRLDGIDVYERGTVMGKAATQFVTDRLSRATEVFVKTHKYNPTFDRQAGVVWVDGVLLADLLREAGFEKSG